MVFNNTCAKIFYSWKKRTGIGYMEKENIRILVVEDDIDLLELTVMQIKMRGYQVAAAATGQQALDIINNEKIDVCLLDVMLPDFDGHELCKRFRSDEIGYSGLIIFASCLGDCDNVVGAFREGGDDYIVKPVQMDVLEERIFANLQKRKEVEASINNKESKDKKQWYKHFVIDDSKHEVYRVEESIQKEKIGLSPKEYNLLKMLVEHEGEVLLYRQMYKEVWGMEDYDDVRTLMVHVSNLRKKLTESSVEVITAIRGVGYIFQDS